MAQNNSQDHPHLTSRNEVPPTEPVNPDRLTPTCHCGRISVDMPFPQASINACRCSICYRYGTIWAYFARKDVSITVNSPASSPTPEDTIKSQVSWSPSQGEEPRSGLKSYVRDDGNGHIGFYFCEHCGCMTHWALTDKGLAFEREKAVKQGLEAPAPRIGINCRMLSPRLIEGVERRAGKDGDF
ncbi:hypothetical protein VP1G_03002 [Cytospora mali]|uniref:CENP-V/GFA domain-containing protein n=1 Tax=Cytospora mali TaxID=578113 RepID=A0A194UVN3_CYTMA|nr:hypothetical protein VP1G_03002 [Valsa mali var. pyri (nom. inval.)]